MSRTESRVPTSREERPLVPRPFLLWRMKFWLARSVCHRGPDTNSSYKKTNKNAISIFLFFWFSSRDYLRRYPHVLPDSSLSTDIKGLSSSIKKNGLIHRLKNIWEKSCTGATPHFFNSCVNNTICSGVICIQSVPKTYFLYKSVANKWSLSLFAVIAVTGFWHLDLLLQHVEISTYITLCSWI